MSKNPQSKQTPYEWVEYDTSLHNKCSFFTQYFNNPPWPFRWHYHADHYEILLHLENPGRYLVGNAAGDLLEGTIFILGPGLAHSFYHAYDNKRPTRCLTVRFPAQQLNKWTDNFPEFALTEELAHKARYGLRYDEIRSTRARALIEQLVGFRNQPSLKAFSSFIELLDCLNQTQAQQLSTQPQRPADRGGKEERINQICGFLIENIKRQITLEEIAELAHMSTSNLCAFFRKKTGRTIIQYVNELRIARACELLRIDSHSILDVAQESGYANLSHFNRQFLRQTGVSPREYRKNNEIAPA